MIIINRYKGSYYYGTRSGYGELILYSNRLTVIQHYFGNFEEDKRNGHGKCTYFNDCVDSIKTDEIGNTKIKEIRRI